MPRKTQGPSKKKAKANVPSEKENEAPATAVAETVAAPSPAAVPITAAQEVVSDPAIKDKNAPVATAADASALVLSKDEAKFILQLRNELEVNKKPAELEDGGEEPSAEESAYAGVFAPTSTLNSVHAHCLGIVPLEPLELRSAVQDALSESKTWEGPQRKMICASLKKAMPILGEKLIGEKGLPVPVSFSADRVVEAYGHILERHLIFTRVLLKRRGKRRAASIESGSDDDDGSVTISAKAKVEEQKALKAVTAEIEESLRIGKEIYSEDHLYECERLLVDWMQWQNPEDGSEQSSTCPKSVRIFVNRCRMLTSNHTLKAMLKNASMSLSC